jgi:CheY-like chemotaxis protein
VASRGAVLTGLHILVVEDNADARAILRMVLTYYGALVTEAPTVNDALGTLSQVAPDVVVTDIILGDTDALALIKGVRRRGWLTPFIAVSAQDFDSQFLESAGFAAYVRKPVEHSRLIDTILAVIARR